MLLETERTPEREARAVVNQDFESEGCAGGYEALPKGLDGTAPDALPTEGPRHEELAEANIAVVGPEQPVRDGLGIDLEKGGPVLGHQPAAHSLFEFGNRHRVRGLLVLDELPVQLGEKREVFGGRFAKMH